MKLLFFTCMFLQHGPAVGQDVVYGIGMKLCNLKCIQQGSCMSFAYDIEKLVCRLSDKNETKLVKEGYLIYPMKGKEVSAGACSLMNCGPCTRCVERHSGATVCVKDVVSEDTGRNIALGQPTIQSSTRDTRGKSNNAVDGDHNPVYNDSKCSHTKMKPRKQWWIVDLSHVYTIKLIVIYNRVKMQDRLEKIKVEGFLHYPVTCDNPVASLSAFHAGPSGDVVNMSFPGCTKAQYIRISRSGPLTLCEVEVYGEAKNDQGRIDSTTKVRTGKTLTRTSTDDLGSWKSHETCLSACTNLSKCYFVTHNAKTGKCKTYVGLVKRRNFKRAPHWNIYSLC